MNRQLSKSGSWFKGAVICVLLALSAGLLTAQAVSGAGGRPTAVTASKKKKCKNNIVTRSCTYKIYHLEADGFYNHKSIAGTYDISQTFHAELDLKRRRINTGAADYTEEGGSITFSVTGNTSPGGTDLSDCSSRLSVNVPERKVPVPSGGLIDNIVYLGFVTVPKPTYSLGGLGNQNGGTPITAPGTYRCDADGRTLPFTYEFDGSNKLDPKEHRGKPWSRRLTGSTENAPDFLRWTLTGKK